MRLSKAQIKAHNQAEEILKQDVLSFEDKLYVMNNWNEAADFEVSTTGAFFTPEDMAADFEIEIMRSHTKQMKLLDLCAGIGSLSFWAYHRAENDNKPKITCVELNHRYVEIGKKILPEANWICSDIISFWQEFKDKEVFDFCYSNPPFGKLQKFEKSGFYTGTKFEYKIIDIAMDFADLGSFILPQNSAPFIYSGVHCYRREENNDYKKFAKETGLHVEAGCGIDTSIYSHFKNTKVLTEIITVEIDNPSLRTANIQAPQPEQMALL